MSAPVKMLGFCAAAVCKVCNRCHRHTPNISGVFSNTILISRLSSSRPIVSPDVKFVPSVEAEFRSHDTSFRKHPGVSRLKSVSLPADLLHSVDVLLQRYSNKDLVGNARKLMRYLWGRKPPVEDDQIRTQAKEIHDHLLSEENTSLETPQDVQRFEKLIQKKTIAALRKQTYHWQPIDYTAYNACLYMVARLTGNYAAVLQCLNEIRLRHQGYRPHSLYDLGSGVGSVVWAAHHWWDHSLKQYHCVDPSVDMTTLAQLLLRGGDENTDMCIPGVHFRQFAPSSQNKFDVTVGAYSLLDIPTQKERLNLVEDLWSKTSHYMVLVDIGTQAGFKLIMEARDHILEIAANNPSQETHVLAPCPHKLACPMLHKNKKSLCVNEVAYHPLPIISKNKLTEKYSYVILSKLKPAVRWPRVVEEVVRSSHHTHLHLCDTDAHLKHLVLTRSKHSQDLYRSSRHTKLGDSLPVVIPDQTTQEQDTPPPVTDREEAWSLQDTPTKVPMPQTGRYMVQCNSTKMDS